MIGARKFNPYFIQSIQQQQMPCWNVYLALLPACLPACLVTSNRNTHSEFSAHNSFMAFFCFFLNFLMFFFFASFQGWLNFRVIKRVQFGCRPYFLLGPKKIKNIMLYGTNNEPLWAHHFDLSVYFFFHVYRASKFSLPLCTRFVATQYSVLYGSFL